MAAFLVFCVGKRETVKSVVLLKEHLCFEGWMGELVGVFSFCHIFWCLEVFGSWLGPESYYFGDWKGWKLENGGWRVEKGG